MDQLDAFLTRNRINTEDWEKSGCQWTDLEQIREDHLSQSERLSQSAALTANIIQKIPGVHSVRWRVKDADHLLTKIVRKKAEGAAKYSEVTVDNYYEVVTDLIGIRALHLFKHDCFEINDAIRATWSTIEEPVAYIRNGDPVDLITKYRANGLEVKEHPAGYRSVHFVIASQPINRKVISEIQIRTIFEEGWSEIDHKVRYPNFSDNQLIGYFLTIFNRMAGSADEMGSFVTWLAASIQDYEQQITQASNERDESISSMEDLLGQLESLKLKDEASKEAITKLQNEVTKLKLEPVLAGPLFSRGMTDVFNLAKFQADRQASQALLEQLQSYRKVNLADLTETSKLAKLLSDPKKKKDSDGDD